MKRLIGEINEPEFFNQDRYIGNLACWDMDKAWKMIKHFRGGKIASIGCLNEAIVPLLAEAYGTEVYGVDFADKVLEFLRSRFPKVKYITHDIRNGVPFQDGYMDYVIAGEIVEHLEDPKKFIDECMRVLKKGGVLSISTPYEEGVKQGAVDKHAHIWSFSEEDFKEWGFETELLKEGIQTSILAWKKK